MNNYVWSSAMTVDTNKTELWCFINDMLTNEQLCLEQCNDSRMNKTELWCFINDMLTNEQLCLEQCKQ